jgi:small nuclear ribonucleoprotein (snRNP)-like protein
MSTRNRLMISSALISSMLLSTITLAAQTTSSTSDWASLRNVPTDSKVSVKLKTGKSVEGRLKSVSDSSVTVTSKNQPVEIKREDVASIYQVTKKSATKSTLIGMGIGAGAGAGIGAIGSEKDNNGFDFDKLDHAVTAGLAVIGAVAGGVTGYLIGRSANKRVLVYESK